MSTTLKALQRIEQDRDRRSSHRPLDTMPVRLRASGGTTQLLQWMRIRWWHNLRIKVVVAFLAGVCLLLVVMGHPQRPIMAPSASEPEPTPAPASGDIAESNHPVMQPNEMKDNSSAVAIPPEPATSIDSSGDRSVTPRKDRPGVPEVFQTENVKPWYGDAIKVLAIVYGSDPSARMAMINDRMVHQGDMVDGYLVVVIEEDAAVVRQGGDLWRAKLGR